ncbi:uncharacterized protein Dvar_45670 [Desulfosarcina variabilis str. Montpellier]|uniref:hypothetical protein n=1 Tax=Desulfosarcina variabilis TaxID=2300 RepID=UPI003AFAB8CE
MKELKHNDKIIINGRKGTVGTVAGYAKQHGDDPGPEIERAKANGHPMCWANQEPTIICNDPGFYERREKEWANPIELKNSRLVKIEDAIYRIRFMGDYSDFVHFIPYQGEETANAD